MTTLALLRTAWSDVPVHGLHLAMVATVLLPGADFLLSRLRSHLSAYWAWYDRLLPPDGPLLPKMARDVLLGFMGYDRSEEALAASGGVGARPPAAAAASTTARGSGRDRGLGGRWACAPSYWDRTRGRIRC